jgi:hypothetical protein
MPASKTPVVSCDWDYLRFFVCNLCAPTPRPEHPFGKRTGAMRVCSGGGGRTAGPFSCQSFIERAAERGGPVELSGRKLIVLPDFVPAYRLFARACFEDLRRYSEGLRCRGPGHTHYDLRDTPSPVSVKVCWQSGDVFDLVSLREGRERRGLRVEPGLAVVLQADSLAGLVGFVRGLPVGVFVEPAAVLPLRIGAAFC